MTEHEAFPKTATPHPVKVWLSEPDRLALAWLTQTTGSSVSGYLRQVIRRHIDEQGVVSPIPAVLVGDQIGEGT